MVEKKILNMVFDHGVVLLFRYHSRKVALGWLIRVVNAVFDLPRLAEAHTRFLQLYPRTGCFGDPEPKYVQRRTNSKLLS